MKKLHPLVSVAIIGIAGVCSPVFADPDTQQIGVTTVLTVPSQSVQSSSQTIDYANAKAMPLPKPAASALSPENAAPALAFSGTPGVSQGFSGSGQLTPVSIPKATAIESQSGISTQEFGSFNHPFTTSRVDAKNNQTSRLFPFRATGKLYFNIGANTFVCSASLIKRGILVTAAHCVADYGTGTFFSNWEYIPAQDDNFLNNAPYGVWTTNQAVVLTSYLTGSSGCSVVCPDDVAVLRIEPQAGAYPGTTTGWLSYGWDGFGFTTFAGLSATQITQLGYPVGLDFGGVMQRSDSIGYNLGAGSFNNTQIGSRQTGGSSGGPWIINLGIDPVATSDTPGTAAKKNVVVGVTSWGYISPLPKVQGASPFTSSNIVPLVSAVCPGPGC